MVTPTADAGDVLVNDGDVVRRRPRRDAGGLVPVVSEAPRLGLAATGLVALWLFAVFGVWALASPLMGVPDEPAHTIKAASIWQGQLRGTPTEVEGTEEMSGDGTVVVDTVRVPESYASTVAVPGCFAFLAHVPVDCAPDMSGSGRIVEAKTMAGPYPPLFYAAVGWPTRMVQGGVGVYLMRLTGAALCALLVAFALRSLSRVLAVPLVIACSAVAVTPMVPFLAGGVNPAGMEICAAMLLWAASLALFCRWDVDGPVPWDLVAELVVGFAVLAHTRLLGPLFCAFALGGVAIFAGWRRCRELLGDRRVLALGAVLAVIGGAAVAWTVLKGGSASLPGSPLPDEVRPLVLLGGETDDFLRQMVAVFGWKDTGPVTPVLAAWVLAGGMLLGLVVLLAPPWRRFVVLMGALAVVVLPVALQLPTLAEEGLAWQGRYLLPFAVGIPMLAGSAIADGVEELGPRVRPTVVLITSLCGAGTVFALYAWLFRSAVGGSPDSLSPFSWSGWDPPTSAGVLLALALVLAVVPVMVVWWLHGGGASPAVEGSPG